MRSPSGETVAGRDSRQGPNELSCHNGSQSASEDFENAIEMSMLADALVPDGGYGWIVILGCGVITWWFVGTTYSWGIIQADLVQRGLSTPATLSFIGSLTVTCIAALAVINAKIIRMLGARRTATLGISFLGLGEILGGFSTNNVGGLFVTVGMIMGIGTR
jgi:hypothetical protein